MQIIYVGLGARVVSFREHIQVHPEFDSFPMKDASRPRTDDLIIVT